MIIPSKERLLNSIDIIDEPDAYIVVTKPLVYDINGVIVVIPPGFKSDGFSFGK